MEGQCLSWGSLLTWELQASHSWPCLDPSLCWDRAGETPPTHRQTCWVLGRIYGTSPGGVLAGSVNQQSSLTSAQTVARSTGQSPGRMGIALKRVWCVVPAPGSYGTAWPCDFGGGYKASGPDRPDSAEMVPGDCEAGLPQHTAGHRPALHWGPRGSRGGGDGAEPPASPPPHTSRLTHCSLGSQARQARGPVLTELPSEGVGRLPIVAHRPWPGQPRAQS